MPPRTFTLGLLAWSIVVSGNTVQAQSPQPDGASSSEGASESVLLTDFCAETASDECVPPTGCSPDTVFQDDPLCVSSAFDFSKVPQTRIFPRPGNFFIPPSGPGYYSLVDQLHGRKRDKPQPSAYPAFCIMAPGFFDADFRYLDSVPMEERRWFERLKRIRIGDNFMFSTGGAAWYRYNHEVNSRLTETNNTYGLQRVRVYGDLWYQDRLRGYVEFISAGRSGGDLPALPIDRDLADLLDAFVDVKIADVAAHPVYVRVGRQELLLGSQRLISPLPWANMRRNFDGVRAFRQGDNFDVDAFWVEPVIPNKNQFDQADHSQQFGGAWFTYRPVKGTFLDLYYLYYNNSRTIVQQGIARAPTHVNTIGSRYAGDLNNYLWDVEGALQFGETANRDLIAGMATVGGGYHWAKFHANPTLWFYYDYASGDANPNAGQATTFNQLFPFGHYYLGWADIAARQNIQDANVHLGLYPVPWLTVWMQYHHFWLAQAQDALYNAGGVAIRRDPTGNAGNNVGDEIDLVMNFHIDAQSDVFFAYAQVFGGSFLQATATPTRAANTEALYLIYNYRW
jgi:Alginate export